MPRREWRFRVDDILGALARIQSYTAGMTRDAFLADSKTVDAVVRNLITIGEAASRIPEEIVTVNPHVPWNDMRDLRNFVVHEYFGISDDVIWETVQNDLPKLPAQLQSISFT